MMVLIVMELMVVEEEVSIPFVGVQTSEVEDMAQGLTTLRRGGPSGTAGQSDAWQQNGGNGRGFNKGQALGNPRF